MKKSSNICFITIVLLIVFLILNMFLFNIKNTYIFSGILLLSSLLLFFLSGYSKNNYRNKKDVFLNILIVLIIYFIITYILGIFTGFLRNPYSLKLLSIVRNMFPILTLILIREFFRYLYYSKNLDSKILYILGLIFFVLLDINLNLSMYGINTFKGIIKTTCFVLFPSITKNVLLNFLTSKTGYENAMFYSMVMELKAFILPIFPDFGDYINIILNTIFPAFLMSTIEGNFNLNESRRIKDSRYRNNNLIIYSIITFIMLIVVMLTSGFFRYYAITVGSGSMSPYIKRGDVVIVKKLKQKEFKNIKIGDVLIYKHDNIIVIHRLVEMKKLNNETYYITKGDHNISKDSYLIKMEDIVGIKVFRIPFIGLPTVQLNEKLSS